MNLINIKQNERVLKITNKGDLYELVLYGEVGGDFFGEGITAKMVSDALKGVPRNSDLAIRINSIGGDVFEGIAIYNRLKQFKGNVTVYIDGLAASIASIIALAGDKVVMGEGAMMMIHKPLAFVYGNTEELETMINRLDEVEEQLLTIYNKKTGIDRIELRKMLADETWLDASQSLELGFVDEAMELDEKVNIAACVDGCKWFKKKPRVKDLNKEIKSKVNLFKEEVEKFLAR